MAAVEDFSWEAIAVDESIEEDPAMLQLVAAMEEDFVAGSDNTVMRHTFMPGGLR